ncbi:MAG: RdgB/HAM1 family non-canonical purine NTP pyrophosphatase [Candidatus Omnitrophica bacterium]|nr:RdgB/HAM1 family non-canonical purine NTP pyrophosphatase [Candidatus Omnitrophota bacterium]
MRTLVLASNNKKKVRELKTILKGMRLKVLSLDEAVAKPHRIVEDGLTFRANAAKKAVTVSRMCDCLVLADDSGLSVDALGGRPGIRSARFAGPGATDTRNNKKLLKLLDNKPPAECRRASFVCVIALARQGHLIGTVEGRCRGTIGFEGRGENGFGYDPLFTPRGRRQTFAEMPAALKHRISHRGRALAKAKRVILKYFSR